jgi:hypothetical protein
MMDKFTHLRPREQKNQPQQIALPVGGGFFEYAVELAACRAGRNFPYFTVAVEGQTVRKRAAQPRFGRG